MGGPEQRGRTQWDGVKEAFKWIALQVLLPISPFLLAGAFIKANGLSGGWSQLQHLVSAAEVLFLGVVSGVYGFRDRLKFDVQIGDGSPALFFLTMSLIGGLVTAIFFHAGGIFIVLLESNTTLKLGVALWIAGWQVLTAFVVHLYLWFKKGRHIS